MALQKANALQERLVMLNKQQQVRAHDRSAPLSLDRPVNALYIYTFFCLAGDPDVLRQIVRLKLAAEPSGWRGSAGA